MLYANKRKSPVKGKKLGMLKRKRPITGAKYVISSTQKVGLALNRARGIFFFFIRRAEVWI